MSLKLVTGYKHYWVVLKLLALYGVVASAIFSWYGVNSSCLIALAACWLLEGDLARKWKMIRLNPFFITCMLFFVLQVVFLAVPNHQPVNLGVIQSNVGFVFIPLVLLSSPDLIEKRKQIMLYSGVVLIIASLYCLVATTMRYTTSHDTSVFFYHALVEPLKHHAIYFSAYILVFLFYFIEEYDLHRKRKWFFSIVCLYMGLFLVLLSSKTLLIVGGLITIYLFLRRNKAKRMVNVLLVLGFVVGATLLLVVDNPVKARFNDVLKGDWKLYARDKYSRDIYFNGFQFRLLQWRLVKDILNERQAWWTGVGEKNAQPRLDEQYTKLDMYRGSEEANNIGYLGYNCHNQYLQDLLQCGLPGLLLLLSMLLLLFRYAFIQPGNTLLSIVVLLAGFFFTESVLERQYGLTLFLVFPLLHIVRTSKKAKSAV